jgi:hypothetical protein
MKKIIFITALLLVSFIGCRNAEQKHQDENKSESTVTTPHEDEGPEHANAIALNNGEKWDANAETTSGIIVMNTMVNGMSDQATLEDYHDLKTKMEASFNEILQKCTMTGEAHNQLHNYLVPMRAIIEKLNAPEIETCREALNELKAHLAEYGNYFK